MTGVSGVIFVKKSKKFIARIAVEGKKKYIGQYDTLEQAAEARKAAEIKHGYHKNHGTERPL
jgi:hypothetical protein